MANPKPQMSTSQRWRKQDKQFTEQRCVSRQNEVHLFDRILISSGLQVIQGFSELTPRGVPDASGRILHTFASTEATAA